jgi:ATP-dependent DNA helicase PIF1
LPICDEFVIDVGDSIFECGQIYVALSRVTSLEGLFLIDFNPAKIKINKKVYDFYNALITTH